MKRSILAGFAVSVFSVVLPIASMAQTVLPAVPAPLRLDQKFQLYMQQAYSLPSVLIPAAVAGIDEAADSPKYWGGGWSAYGKRFGTVRGEFQSRNFSVFGVGAMLHEDPRFPPSRLHGSWPRTNYVLLHTLVAQTDSGGRQPAFGTFAGALTSGFVPSAWLPPSENSWKGTGAERNISCNDRHEYGDRVRARRPPLLPREGGAANLPPLDIVFFHPWRLQSSGG
jgi:hypothetical protein